MKKLWIAGLAFSAVVLVSCGNSPDTTVTKTDTTLPAGPDSAANNGIIPPSAAPGNADNSSLADTTYHHTKKDSVK